MKKTFSREWKSSTQPRKQRKYRHNAPNSTRQKLMSAHLSPELRKQHGKRSITLKANDIAKVMKGDFKGKTGKITEINTRKLAAYVEGAERTRRDGTKVMVPIKAANLMITELSAEGGRRLEKNA